MSEGGGESRNHLYWVAGRWVSLLEGLQPEGAIDTTHMSDDEFAVFVKEHL